jgi:hypothetical protein
MNCPFCKKVLRIEKHPRHEGRVLGYCPCTPGKAVIAADAPADGKKAEPKAEAK